MLDRRTLTAEDASTALHVADDLDDDSELELSIEHYDDEIAYSSFLTLGQVRKLRDHLERVLNANSVAPTPTFSAEDAAAYRAEVAKRRIATGYLA